MHSKIKVRGNEAFHFDLYFPVDYPSNPPLVFLVQSSKPLSTLNFLHDSMDKETGQILLPIFSDEWTATLNLVMILHALEILVSVSDDVGSVG